MLDKILAVFLALVAYILYLVITRLYLSPIAHFPGPKLAALTRWYEGYYDMWLGGQFTFKIIEMHKKYGSIVRISPWELHVSDPDYLPIIYPSAVSSKKINKSPWFVKFLNLDYSVFSTIDHDLHKKRRSALLPYFSKASVQRLQPVIQERVDTLLRRMGEFKDSGRVMNGSHMHAAFTSDLVKSYCFARCDHALEDPNFDPWSRDASISGATSGKFMKHMPWGYILMKAMPESLISYLSPTLSMFVIQQRICREQVVSIKKGQNQDWKSKDHPTVFHAILDTKLPPEEKTDIRLAQDAQMLVMAGTLTSAFTLDVIMFNLLSHPTTLQKLKAELREAYPNRDDVGKLPLSALEQLPYLSAVIKEGLRLSYGVANHMPRFDPENDVVLKDKETGKEWVIPAGTPIGSSATLLHHREEQFPNPLEFIAERWLGEEGRALDKYLVSFSMGSRRCVGYNVAQGELYLVTSGIWRLWGSEGAQGPDDVGVLTLWETSRKDVDIVSADFVPRPQKGSKGIRVTVTS